VLPIQSSFKGVSCLHEVNSLPSKEVTTAGKPSFGCWEKVRTLTLLRV
jgi:hypothetical protein